jgi:4-amino-4-deoxy-L-arabinose transferase-like glycosyltransferase
LQEIVARCGPLRLTGWQGLVLVVLLAAALRVHALGTRCFHGDELLSISIASSSRMAELQRSTAPAWHPPLHYAVPRLLYLAGASTEAQWRIAGVLFGVLTAAVSFLIPWAWGASRIGFVAGLLTATSPMAVLFSQSVRWHPLVGGMLALGALGLVLVVHRERFWGWLLAGVCFALAFQTIYVAGIPALLMLLLALYHVLRNGKPLTGFLSAILLWTVAVAPSARVLASWLQPGALHWEPLRSSLGVPGKLLVLLQNLTVGPTVMPWNWLVTVPAVVLLSVLAWRFVTTRQSEVTAMRSSVLAVVAVCILVALIAPLTASSRYWLILLVPVHIAMAGGAVSITSARWRQLAFLMLAAIVGYGLLNLYGQRQYQYRELMDDWCGLAELTRHEARPGDEVWSVMTPFVHYYGPDALNVCNWYHEPRNVAQHLQTSRPSRVFLQYSPLSDWEVISFAGMAEVIGAELQKQGFERQSQIRYGFDSDAAKKRYYMRGRDFPDYRHMLEMWAQVP